MNKIKVENAIGMTLCHDITKIVPGEFKGVVFKKGHIIKEEDIPVLLSCGKQHIFVWEENKGFLHENDAALRLADLLCGKGIVKTEIKEGKIEFVAGIDGLLKIKKENIDKLNMLGEIIVSTIHNNTVIKKGEKLGATKVVPLLIEEEKIINAEKLIKSKTTIEITEFKPKKVALIVTGSEVYSGKIKDGFFPVITQKLKEFNSEIVSYVIISDESEKITEEINKAVKNNVDLIFCTGGMSVDPDDLTPFAIKQTGANIITYGTPVLPGAMFLVSYLNNIPVLGLPGNIIFAKRTVFDLILPRILCDEKLTFEQLAKLGYGGFCLNCNICTFPHCSFGKGE